MKQLALLFLLFPILISCGEYSPKPTGYFRIDIDEPIYQTVEAFDSFRFDLTNSARLTKYSKQDSENFCIVYDKLNAEIFCTFIPIKNNNITELSEESRKFVHLQVIKADAIHEMAFENPEQSVFGMVYQIKGNVASPTQFVLTDSVSSFFRGALFFNNPPNQDSIAPVLEYVNKDIQVIIESFQWK